jgi:hypothetical protein
MGFTARHQDGTKYWHAGPKEGLDATCGGTGYLHCYCGGDLCVCGNFGETECYGCEDCDGDRDDSDYEDDDRPYDDE